MKYLKFSTYIMFAKGTNNKKSASSNETHSVRQFELSDYKIPNSVIIFLLLLLLPFASLTKRS